MMQPFIERVQTLIARMTLAEKLAQIGSYWMYELQSGGLLDENKVAAKLAHGIGQITRVAGASTLDPVSAARTANSLQKFLMERTRLGIPAILHEECCSGAMVLGGTMYPQMLGLAATFQPELAKEMSGAIGKQLRAIGARQGLAPRLSRRVAVHIHAPFALKRSSAIITGNAHCRSSSKRSTGLYQTGSTTSIS